MNVFSRLRNWALGRWYNVPLSTESDAGCYANLSIMGIDSIQTPKHGLPLVVSI